MNKTLLTLALGGLMLSSASAQITQTIFSDDFADASKWSNYAGGTNAVTVSEGVLSLSRTATNGHVYMGTVFAEPVTLLKVGDILTFDFRMVLERTATGMDISMTRNGASLVEISDNAVPNANFYTFNMISFGYYNRGTANSLDIDSMSVTLTPIPEPSTYAALFGLMALGFVAWRRRR